MEWRGIKHFDRNIFFDKHIVFGSIHKALPILWSEKSIPWGYLAYEMGKPFLLREVFSFTHNKDSQDSQQKTGSAVNTNEMMT